MRSSAKLCLAAACVAAVACRRSPEKTFGEPVGIRIESGQRKLDVSASVLQGEDIAPHLQGLAGALAKAGESCLGGEEAAIQIEVIAGTIRVPTAPATRVERCLAGTLDGKSVGTSTAPLHVRIRMVAE